MSKNGKEEPAPEISPELKIVNQAKVLRTMIAVEPIRNTDMIEIKVVATNANEAAIVTNTLTEAYASLNRKQSQEEVTQVKTFLDDQLKLIQAQLAESENALKEFQEKENVVSLSSETTELIRKIAEFETLYNTALTDLNSGRERLAYINEQLKLNKQNFDFESITAAPYLEHLRGKITSLEQERASKTAALINEGANYNDHPQIRQIDERISFLTEEFEKESAKIISRNIVNPVAMSEDLLTSKIEVEASIASLKPRVEVLKDVVDKYAAELDDLPEKSLRLAQLQRAAQVDEKIFLMMKEKYQESRITEVGQLGDVRIIDEAAAPEFPIAPRKRMNLMLGMIIGLGLGIGLTFLLESMDNSVRTIEDLERLGIPVLGSIPLIDEEDAAKRVKTLPKNSQNGKADSAESRKTVARLISHFAPKSPISEAYRTFRTNIQYTKTDATLKTLLVTSPGPGEGKSTTIANLAITLSQSGNRVLLVDADLRRPVLHSIFGTDRSRGLTNVLVGKMEIDDVVQKTEIENLFLMPCGTLPPNPSELLGSSSMEKVIEALKDRFDVILFDSPPIIAVTDAAVLGSKVDGLVVVVKSGQTFRDATQRAKALINNVKIPVLGALLNGVRIESMYGSYYYYYHYYYYGKDNDKKKKRKSRKKRDRAY